MDNKKTLKEKIIHSVFLYETKKISFETMIKIGIFLTSLAIIFIFGGVIYDIYTENELGDLLADVVTKGEYSFMKIREAGTVFTNEIPHWIIASYLIGIFIGCILLVSIIKNWSSVSRKMRSLVRYWFNI